MTDTWPERDPRFVKPKDRNEHRWDGEHPFARLFIREFIRMRYEGVPFAEAALIGSFDAYGEKPLPEEHPLMKQMDEAFDHYFQESDEPLNCNEINMLARCCLRAYGHAGEKAVAYFKSLDDEGHEKSFTIPKIHDIFNRVAMRMSGIFDQEGE